MNPDSRRVFDVRARAVTAIRRFLDSRGFVEVETPMMQPIAGGAAARPFVTHHNTLDMDLYLRIAPELYLKRLVVGGMERVYEISAQLPERRGVTQHNPEFTMLEFYQAYADYHDLMAITEEMHRGTAREAVGTEDHVQRARDRSSRRSAPVAAACRGARMRRRRGETCRVASADRAALARDRRAAGHRGQTGHDGGEDR